MVDPGIALGAASAIILTPVVQDLLKRVAGPAADEVGDWWRDTIHAYRTRNVAAVITRASEILTATGTAARKVPLRPLLPLLDGAANEDQAELQDRWAALLARAAAGETVGPFYVYILRQVTPFDAQLLTEVARFESSRPQRDPVPGEVAPSLPWGISPSDLLAAIGATDSERLEVSLTILRSLGLLDSEPPVRADEEGYFSISDASEVRISRLGRRFLAACTPPPK